MASTNEYGITADPEKTGAQPEESKSAYIHGEVERPTGGYTDDDAEVVASEGWFRSWLHAVERVNVEARGIERVKPEDRNAHQTVWDGFTLWAAANFTASTFATGCLGPIFGLGFWDSFAVIVIINFCCSWLVGLFGTFGPLTGCRQIVMSRFSFGIWGSRLLVILNLCSMVGWAAVNSIAGAQILNALSDGKCPLWAANLVIGITSSIICFFGYHIIHIYERWSWIPQVFVMCFLAGYGAKHFDASKAPMGHGQAEAAGCMSFIATIYGFTAGWAATAADYNVRMPENTNKWKLATTIWAGNFFGASLTMVLGAAFMSAVAADPALATAYDNSGIGGLMQSVLVPLGGFGKFLLVIMGMSIVGCNVINNYSLAFMAQNLGDWALKVPRFLWTILGSIVFIVFAIAGEESFAEVLESFLSVIGYYITPYYVVILIEHFGFRHRRYPLEDWNNLKVVPHGFAGVASVCLGFVGAVLSMDQTWYVGVVARSIKPDGAELGWIFSGSFAAIAFVPLRLLEKKYTGR